MNLLDLRKDTASGGSAEQMARSFVQALLSNDPAHAHTWARDDAEFLGQPIGSHWATLGRAFVRAGATKLQSTHTVPRRALSLLPANDHEAIFGGPLGQQDELVIINLAGRGEGSVCSIGLVLDESSGSAPKIRRLFDPVPFADLVEQLPG